MPSIRLVAALALVLLATGCGVPRSATNGGRGTPGERFDATVQRVVDGDTVVLAPGGRARLIGIDTPEVYGHVDCYGPEASAFAKRRLGGRRVTVEVGTEPRDRYGRLLVYLYAGGRMFNDELARDGYARTMTIAPNVDRADDLRAASAAARTMRRGLWAAC